MNVIPTATESNGESKHNSNGDDDNRTSIENARNEAFPETCADVDQSRKSVGLPHLRTEIPLGP